jgi:hypothetical protein
VAADIRHVKEYAKLESKRQKLGADLDAIKARQEELREAVLEYFSRQGIDKLSLEGRTLYVREELWAGREDGVSNEEAASALEAAGLGDYAGIRINTQKLSAYVRELARNEEEIPAPLKGVIKVSQVYKIGSRAR